MLILIAIAGMIIQDWSSFWITAGIFLTISVAYYYLNKAEKIQKRREAGRKDAWKN